jgi:hypothetical protein
MTLVPYRSCCLADHRASPAACHAGRVATPAPLSRSPRCHADPAALLTIVPAGRVSGQPCSHAGPAATQSAPPCRPCCPANHSASSAACHATRVATPVPLPQSPRCHAGPAALPAALRAWFAPAVLPRQPRCHPVCTATQTLLPCQPQCLVGRMSRQPCCHTCPAATQSALPSSPHCQAVLSASPTGLLLLLLTFVSCCNFLLSTEWIQLDVVCFYFGYAGFSVIFVCSLYFLL